MRSILLSIIVTTAVVVGFNQFAFAVCSEGPPDTFTCDTNPPNPDTNGIQQQSNNNDLTINVLPDAIVDTTLQPGLDDDAIGTGNGNNTVTVEDAIVRGHDEGIQTRDGNDSITITNSEIFSVTENPLDAGDGNNTINVSDSFLSGLDTDQAIDTGFDNDIVNITNSILLSRGGDVLFTNDGEDTITVSGSELKVTVISGSDAGIFTRDGNDNVFVERSVIQGATDGPTAIAIELGSEDDTLTIGTGVELRVLLAGDEESFGIIDCGEGFDTLVFAMEVPEERLNFFSNQIALATLPDGNVTIDGLYYEWENCELLVNELVGVRVTRPIPTLSQWGMIAMAGLIGIVGFIAVRRRVTA